MSYVSQYHNILHRRRRHGGHRVLSTAAEPVVQPQCLRMHYLLSVPIKSKLFLLHVIHVNLLRGLDSLQGQPDPFCNQFSEQRHSRGTWSWTRRAATSPRVRLRGRWTETGNFPWLETAWLAHRRPNPKPLNPWQSKSALTFTTHRPYQSAAIWKGVKENGMEENGG